MAQFPANYGPSGLRRGVHADRDGLAHPAATRVASHHTRSEICELTTVRENSVSNCSKFSRY